MDPSNLSGYEFILSIGFLVLGFFFHAYITKTNAIAASKQAKAILDEAQKEAEVVRREAKVQAKDAILRARENSEREFTKTALRTFLIWKRARGKPEKKTMTCKLEMLNSKEMQLTGRYDRD